ncbi:alpha-xenorhabdolysin family binary toxin subunit A [Morganella morganii]|uniref:alpha-xenorhabdolysin family binary toxin subunit A n=1 Tax=Morganella morganii TaxID=582 RepID=UPI001966D535|nr:alpha-xenorhabdolysin family binary toxin subunit A [Morganella morganii]EKT0590709.1 alpha-xenorhabdolysin family binary toxin subunit A [Morganella morganii]ELF0882638.1 alpha-xenorhabdolysin family binary toxin subunit A [Morganella morganii]MBT0387317.1 alpha-xenorhabdolysin family binary toxin subunit A [Morganella morganii subsp. morganii]MBT0396198.1 alpha-xenorhabdolysin family binary toxin subunit A [Morganella morganii subsp. morganii]MBT0518680.1 alpha-xenorhabdolysin family bina
MHTQTMPADRIITADEIAPATLKLLLNEEDDTFRPAGIFTHNDLVHIKRYIHYGMTLPRETEDVIEFIGYRDTELTGFEPHNIQRLFFHIHQHALSWEHVESMTKQQAIDLEITGAAITSTGNYILNAINEMPVIRRAEVLLQDGTADKLKDITYRRQDNVISGELTKILSAMKDDITEERRKTQQVKNIISRFRLELIGGTDESGNEIPSLIYEIKRKQKTLLKNRDSDATRDLQSEIRVRNEEIEILKREYNQFVKLSFSGLVGGIIGLIITGGIFGYRAEQVRRRKNKLLEEVAELEEQVIARQTIQQLIIRLDKELSTLDGYFTDAHVAVDHLDFMWQVMLTEITESLNTFVQINDAYSLLQFSLQLKKITLPWQRVRGYAKELVAIFDTANLAA